MSAPDFLTSMAQAISTMNLYEDGHPARDRAVDKAYQHVLDLQSEKEQVRFTFLGAEIVFAGRPLREMKSWDWSTRLAEAGIQRIEFTGPVQQPEFEAFLEDLLGHLSGKGVDTSEARQTRETNIRYGAVELRNDGEEGGTLGKELATATISYTLREEADTVEWIHEELRDRDDLHLLEAEAVVRSLSVAMHGDQQFLIPLLRLKHFDQYTTTHALNVSVLAMALAEFVGLGPAEVRTFGISGLLHDLGKVKIPEEILNKTGKLTDEERSIMNNHTTEGARIIMETEDNLDLAAVVAYEHHIRLNGEGYPSLSYPRPCHQASNMVHVCDVFDALRTHRPYRDAWEHERVIDYLQEGAGSEFEPTLAHAFVQMMERWEHRIAELEETDEGLPLTGSPDAPAEGMSAASPVTAESAAAVPPEATPNT